MKRRYMSYTVETDPVEASAAHAVFIGMAYGCLIVVLIVLFCMLNAALELP